MDVRRLREWAGCTSLCALSADEGLVAPRIHLIHNGVSYSRHCAIDLYLLVVAEDATVTTVVEWLKAHHRGDESKPFRFEIKPGQFVEVPEYDEAR